MTRDREQELEACLERCRLAFGNIAEELRRARLETRTVYSAIDDICLTLLPTQTTIYSGLGALEVTGDT